MRRRKGVSAGTVFMILFTVMVLVATFAVMRSIRLQEGNLAMDAEQLLESVNELVAISRRHLQTTIAPEGEQPYTPAPAHAAVIYTPVPDAVALQPALQTPEMPAVTTVPHTRRQSLTMTFGGAVMLESAVVDGAYNKTTEAYAFEETLAGISSAVHADLNIAVLENTFSANAAKGNDLVAPLQALQSVISAGFDGVALGTEHALAGGTESAEETLRALQNSGMIAVGLNLPGNTQHMKMLRVNGMQVALLSYTEMLSQESQRAVPDKEQRNTMVQLFSEEQAIEDILLAKQRGAQAVIVFMHWGSKAATAPTQAQKKTAQALSDAGANVIIGTRSDAVQHVDLISAADGSHETLVAWSLGTLLNEDRGTREVVSGVLLHAQLTYDAQSGRLSISGIEYTPTYSWRQEENGALKYRVLISSQPAPEGMIQKQKEQMGRARTLIQTSMSKGIGMER